MKNIIYYFSGTGNSLYVAKKIAAELPDCEVVSVASSSPGIPDSETERIGFVYPVYGGGLPHMMARFICNLDFTAIARKDIYVFAVATYGACALNGIRDVPSLLRLKGFLLSYGAAVRMPENYILMFNRPADTEKILANSRPVIQGIADAILRKEKTKAKKPIPIFRLFHILFMQGIQGTAKKFTVSDACTGCGLCVRVCPAKNISLMEGKPFFSEQCESCMACIQHCPSHAYHYKRDISGRERYVNEDISAEELAAGNL